MLSAAHVLIKTKTCAQMQYILSSQYGGGGEVWEMSRSEKWPGGEMAKVGEVEGMSVRAKRESGGWLVKA